MNKLKKVHQTDLTKTELYIKVLFKKTTIILS